MFFSGVSKVGTSSTQTRLCQQLKLPVDRSIVYISMLNSFKFVSLFWSQRLRYRPLPITAALWCQAVGVSA